MRLSRLLATLPPELVPRRGLDLAEGRDPVIRGIAYDSRSVSPGDLFVALKGAQSDGHQFIEQALPSASRRGTWKLCFDSRTDCTTCPRT